MSLARWWRSRRGGELGVGVVAAALRRLCTIRERLC